MDVANKWVLIIEDEAAIREMLRFSLQLAGFSVMEAEDAKTAYQIIAGQLPDIILLDWMLPANSGLDIAKRLKSQAHTQGIPIIMLTAKAEEDSKVKALEIGADDYVVKPFSPRELIARIKAVLRRGSVDSLGEIIIIDDLQLDSVRRRVSIGEMPIKLTKLGFQLLHFLITHPDRTYTRDQLLTYVWGDDVYIDERTVDVQIKRLRKALSKSGYADRIITVHGIGYYFSGKAI